MAGAGCGGGRGRRVGGRVCGSCAGLAALLGQQVLQLLQGFNLLAVLLDQGGGDLLIHLRQLGGVRAAVGRWGALERVRAGLEARANWAGRQGGKGEAAAAAAPCARCLGAVAGARQRPGGKEGPAAALLLPTLLCACATAVPSVQEA